jgi:3-hydroxybutyryl-CoA dehydrogenase
MVTANVTKVAVIGAGQMGAGIAQVAAVSGLSVVLVDAELALAERGKRGIEALLRKQLEKGRITLVDVTDTLGRIRTAAQLLENDELDLVVEAAPERLELKCDLFSKLDKLLPAHTIFASNTSSVSITAMAAATTRPDRVIGMHFMNPAPVMKLVEIVRGLQTSDATYESVKQLAERLGKNTVLSREAPGFIVNRILIPMLNEAVFVLEEGLASRDDIDSAMVLGTNQPLGPLALADLIGLDTVLAIAESLHRELGDDKYRPAPLLRRYVAAGWLGKKTRRGFYEY